LGYAKPVPVNTHYLTGPYDEALVAAAGPGTNILLALLFGCLIRFGSTSMSPALLTAFITIVIVNISLGIFNLIPIPPLDGSKVLTGILPGSLGEAFAHFRANFERMGFFVSIIILLVFANILAPYYSGAVFYLTHLLTGIPL
jgi:Zn-dependent protease